MVIKTQSFNKTNAIQNTNLPVEVSNIKTDIFGVQSSSQYTSLITDYINSNVLNTQLYEQFLNGGGSINPRKTGFLDIDIGTGIGDFALVRNKRVLKYRNGYTYIVRGALQFDENGLGVVNSLQAFEAGLGGNSITIGHNENGMYLGISTGGRNHTVVLKISVASTSVANATIVLNSVSYTVPLTSSAGATGTAIGFTGYEIGAFTYSGWDVLAFEDCVVFSSTSLGPKSGTYSFTHATAVASFTEMTVGVLKTDKLFYQEVWNGDRELLEFFNPYLLTEYEISYSGIGAIFVKISKYDSAQRKFRTLHNMDLSAEKNMDAFESIDFYIQRYTASLGSTTALSLKSTGVLAGYFGNGQNYQVNRSEVTSATLVSNVRQNLAVIKHLRFQNGMVISNGLILASIGVSCDGVKIVDFRVSIENVSDLDVGTGVVSDYPEFKSLTPSSDNALFSPESIFVVDENSITNIPSAKDNIILQITLPKTGSERIDLINRNIYIGRNDVLVVSALSTGSSDVSLTIGFFEDI